MEESKRRIINLIEKSGKSMKGFAEEFSIPYRTLQDWKYGNTRCPEYVLLLLEKAIMNDCQNN